MSPTKTLPLATLVRKREWWRVKEIAAHTRWRRLVATGKQSQKRTDAYNAWVSARDHRRAYDTRIAKIDVIHVDDKGADEIANREGVIPYAYNDSRRFATAWVGHLIAQRPVNASDLAKWGSKKNPAPHDKVMAFFKKDLASYEKAVASVSKERVKNGHLALTQNQFNACVSFCFNIGIGGFLSSRAANLIRSGARDALVADAMMMWNKPPEIIGRRRQEATQFTR